MNISHALAFLCSGIVMLLLPTLAPSLAEVSAKAASARELWLLFMGSLHVGLGGGWIVRTTFRENLRPAVLAWAADRDRRSTPSYATWQRAA